MAEYGEFPEKIEIFRGFDKYIYLEILDRSTKLPVDYTASTFTAYLIDQEDQDYTILATFSAGACYSISSSTATLHFKLDDASTACLTANQAYLRIIRTDLGPSGDKFIYAIGEVEVRD